MNTKHSRYGTPPRKLEPLLLGHTRDGFAVFDRHNSHLHLDKGLIAEALARIDAPLNSFAKYVVKMGRIVGTTSCVPTAPADEIVFGLRPNRAGLTRFVKNRQASPCDSIIIVLKRVYPEKAFVLITAFIGVDSEPEPWDRSATSVSLAFWGSHALIYGPDEIVAGSETTVCPW